MITFIMHIKNTCFTSLMETIFTGSSLYSYLHQPIAAILLSLLVSTLVSTTPDCQLERSAINRITKDLGPFKNGISAEMLQTAKSIDDTCLVVFVDNKLVANDCLSPSKKCVFSSVAAHLPNMEFVVNLRDEPRIYKNPCKDTKNWVKCACDPEYEVPDHGYFIEPNFVKGISQKAPLFSQGIVSSCFIDILIPSFIFLESRHQSEYVPWNEKKFKAIWRGSTTGGYFWYDDSPHHSKYHRQRLIKLCQNITDCDSKFSAYIQCGKNCDKMRHQLGPQNWKSLNAQNHFKMLIDIDGNSYSGRFPKLLFLGSVVLKIGIFQDFATVMTKAWEHYIPVRMDMKDLERKIEWVRYNDREARRIADKGRKRANLVFRKSSYECYITKLLMEYHRLLIKSSGRAFV